MARAPRYAPELPLPAAPWRPGRPRPRLPLPDVGAAGGAAGRAWRQAAQLPAAARTAFRYGVDLYNAGCCWEAHEAWEALWSRSVRGTPLFHLLQGLILLAAARHKAACAQPRGAERLAARACRHLAAPRLGTAARSLGLRLSEPRAACAALLAAGNAAAGPSGAAPGPPLRLAARKRSPAP
jgi:uncharacterized protein